MARLVTYDKDNISPKIIKKIKTLVADPIMEVEHVAKVSVAAKSLCMWVHAMEIYDTVAREVEPKRERLAEMNQVLASANDKLAVKQAELKAVTDRVDALKKKCDDTVAEKQAVTEEIERTKQRLVRAEKLTVGLADELVRWKLTVEQTGDKAQKLIGDVFLASAAISYYGAFTGMYRKKLMSHWKGFIDEKGLPGTDKCTLISALSHPVRVREWQLNGLPTDSTSTGNAIMVARGLRWPLMIDPQEQAKRWIKKSESKKGLVTCPMSDENLIRSLETAVRTGRPLLIEDIGEDVQLVLDPILLKQVFKQSGRTLIHLGDADVDYDENFRFYMTTKLQNPHYTPEVCIKVTVINFTVTQSGLEDQLLEHVVRKERPDVERRKNALVISMAGDRKQLDEIEKKILRLLSASTGNILDDEDLVNTLASSKTTSSIINERVIESAVTQEEVDSLRDEYRPVAIRGALIYFVIASFVVVDPMYQYSLEYFIKLFIFCIDNAAQNHDNLDIRLDNLKNFITGHMYKQVCRGLFQRHTLTFSFLMTCSILRHAKQISDIEFSTMLRGAVDVSEPIPAMPHGTQMTSHQWATLMTLESRMPLVFEGFQRCLLGDVAASSGGSHESKDEAASESKEPISPEWNVWETWSARPDCSSVPMPNGWSDKLTSFQRTLVVKSFREDLAIRVVSEFIKVELGETFTVPPAVSMADVFSDTDARTPCVFVLSPGADPTSILLQFAESRNYAKRLKIISLGQGQGARAETLIAKSAGSGDWVLLQNCHLAKSWMESLERIVFDISEGITDVDRNFRLFLTSFPAKYFPVSVLQTSIKMTNEPPQGLRANILRSFDLAMPKDMFKGRPRSALDRARRRVLFSLAFFHAIVQERRKFGPLGWNIRYEFNDSDIVTSISTLEMFLEGVPKNDNVDRNIPWDALLYVTGEINYGGRVTDDWDRRCLNTILKRSYCADILGNGKFPLSKSGEYFIPSSCTIDSIIKTLKTLPANDPAEVFGLHENAGVAAQEAATAAMFDCILSMQPKSSGASSGEEGEVVKSDDDIVSSLSKHLEEQVPDVMDRTRAGPNTFRIMPESGLMDSLGVVLSQELEKFNKLIITMKVSLALLQRAIKGLELMSDELDAMFTNFRNNKVPKNWSEVGYSSLKPLGSWVLDTIDRVEFMRTWLRQGAPTCFPLYLFFFPQGFLTGALQNHARKHRQPINRLDFRFEVLQGDGDDDRSNDHEDILEPPEDGVIVYGIWMQGARWTDDGGGHLEDSRKGIMFDGLPPVHLVPELAHVQAPGTYMLPCYKTTTRAGALSTTGTSTNFVFSIELPMSTVHDSMFWTLNGTAGILNLND
jgi:dynein heavy chain